MSTWEDSSFSIGSGLNFPFPLIQVYKIHISLYVYLDFKMHMEHGKDFQIDFCLTCTVFTFYHTNIKYNVNFKKEGQRKCRTHGLELNSKGFFAVCV